MTDEKIKLAARILKGAYDRVGDKDHIIVAKDEVLGRYGSIFNSVAIGNITWDDFKGFLGFKNNKHWSNIDIQAKLNRSIETEFEDKLRPALAYLLNEEIPIEDRIDKCFKIKGIDRATVTPILLVAFPEKYGVWNSISEWTLKTLGLWLESYPAKSTDRISAGKVYKYINETLNKLSKEMGVDLWSLDAIFYYYSFVNPNQVCVELKVGEKYSRKDLCDLFFPEFKFGVAWGKVGITGVITFDMKFRKDYGLFATTERSTDRQRPEVVQGDGIFEWITQQKIKDRETPLVKSLKRETKSQVLLFLKKTIEEEDFTYFGPLEFISEYRDEMGDRRFVYRIDSWASIEQILKINGSSMIVPLDPTPKAKLTRASPPSFVRAQEDSNRGPTDDHRSRMYDNDDAENRKLGKAGECLVMEYEKEKLRGTGLKPEHVALHSDKAGYDIKSYERSGEDIFIEVKTTRQGINTPFFISENEYRVSRENSDKYRLYRLFNYHYNTGATFYIKEGDLGNLNPKPVKYIVKIRSEAL